MSSPLVYTPISQIAPAVAGVRAAYASGRTRPLSWRYAQLRGLISLYRENESAILAALKVDLRKPDFESVFAEELLVIAEAEHAIAHLASWAADESVDTPLMLAPASSYVRKEPFGVALIIAPWNYPIMLSLAALVSALAAGNAAVIKPSEVAPACAALLGELLPKYVDADAVRVVQGGVVETGLLLAERFDIILYTGNGTVARIVMAAAALNLTPTILELGGKNPAFVDASADLRSAARSIVHGRCSNAGQVCLAPEYVLVDASVEAGLISELKKAIVEFYGKDPQKSPDFARIVNARHWARINGLLAEVKGCVVAGGESDASDLYIAPTLLRNPPETASIWRDEVFGPLLCVKPVKSLEEAAAFVRERDKPLALYVFSTRSGVAERAMTLMQSGGVTLNGTLQHIAVPSLPFGGVGPSGMGSYHGKRGFDAFSHARAVHTSSRLVPVGDIVAYPPYTSQRLWLIRAFYGYIPARLFPASTSGWLIAALAATVVALALKVANVY